MKEETIMPIIFIAITLIILITIAVTLAITIKRRRQQHARQSVADETLVRRTSGEGVYEGVPYSYKHFKGTDKAPPYFSISIACDTPGSFAIKKESKFDRFFKKLGICMEIETHDFDFDNTFFINTKTIPFTRIFLEKPENRSATVELFGLGFNYLKHDGKTLTITWNGFPRGAQMEIPIMEKAVAQLAIQGKHLADINPTEYEREEASPWKAKRFVAFFIPVMLLVTGIIAIVLTLTTFEPLDTGKMFVNSLKMSLPLLVIFIWTAIRLLKGRSSSHHEFIAVFIIAFFGFPLAGFGYTGYLNGVLDQGTPSVYRVPVINKYYTRSKNSYSYHAVVNSWRESKETEKLGVSKAFFNRLQPGVSKIAVTTKPGKYGYEWVVTFGLSEETDFK